MTEPINRVIPGTEIFVFSRDDDRNYTFFRQFESDEAVRLAGATNKAIRDYDSKGLLGYNSSGCYYGGDGWELSVYRDQITNVSPLRGILVNQILMQQTEGRSWLPTIGEAIQLRRAGIYPARDIVNFGLALYNRGNQNLEVAKSLIQGARGLGFAPPIFASFKALDLQKGGKRYGVIPRLVSAEGVYSGKGAQNLAEENRFELGIASVCNFNWKGGDWEAFRSADSVIDPVEDLDYFDPQCVAIGLSTICDEKTLEKIVKEEIRRNYDSQRKRIEAQRGELETRINSLESSISELFASERATIESAEAVLKQG